MCNWGSLRNVVIFNLDEKENKIIRRIRSSNKNEVFVC
ncbi:hypothetical protein WANG_p1124 (plasmid) [Lactobacillus kefiranofaciens subsp. kefiranofaciens]|nr:hypothetical protein WANG_p1124 [Lactobacillus kefiranofaciens subsp. kefiranofaciens]